MALTFSRFPLALFITFLFSGMNGSLAARHLLQMPPNFLGIGGLPLPVLAPDVLITPSFPVTQSFPNGQIPSLPAAGLPNGAGLPDPGNQFPTIPTLAPFPEDAPGNESSPESPDAPLLPPTPN